MAVTLQITDGTTTVDLSADYIDYVPMAAPSYEEWVEEMGRFRFDTGIAGWRTDIQNIGRLFTQAKEYQSKKVGPRVFVKFKWQSSDDLYRSEVSDGWIVPDRNTMGVGMANAPTPTWGNFEIHWTRRNFWEDDTERTLPARGFNLAGGTAQIYNSYYTTDVAGTSLKVTSGVSSYTGTIVSVPLEAWLYPPVVHYTLGGAQNGTYIPAGTVGGTIGGGSILSGTIDYNTGVWSLNFSGNPTGTITGDFRYGYGNYIDIPGTAVAGDLPAPVKIAYHGGTTANNYIMYMYIGAMHGGTVNINNVLEAEDTVISGTAVSSASASKGSINSWDAANTDEFDTGITFNTINENLLIQNDYLVPIMRIDGTPADTGGTYSIYNINYRSRLYNGINTYNSEYFQLYPLITALGTYDPGYIRFQPVTMLGNNYDYLEDTANPTTTSWEVQTTRIGTSVTAVLKADFVQFFPTNGGYAEIINIGAGALATAVYDGINSRSYRVNLGTSSYVLDHHYGDIRVYPGDNNRIYTLIGNQNSLGYTLKSAINAPHGVVLNYRSRKRII